MPDQIQCPKCKSTQITAQKKGFSTGKAVPGVVLTGGVGALAGTIGSGDIRVTCLNCGHHWEPKAEHTRQQQERLRQAGQKRSQQQKVFLDAYESGDLEGAKQRVPDAYAYTYHQKGVEAVYQAIKTAERENEKTTMIMIGLLVLIIIFLLWLFS